MVTPMTEKVGSRCGTCLYRKDPLHPSHSFYQGFELVPSYPLSCENFHAGVKQPGKFAPSLRIVWVAGLGGLFLQHGLVGMGQVGRELFQSARGVFPCDRAIPRRLLGFLLGDFRGQRN